MIVCNLHGKNDTLKPRYQGKKEMFYSNLLNDIKPKHVGAYMRYLLQMISCVMNGHDLTRRDHELILKELKRSIPVVVTNKPSKIYDVEKKVNEMLEQRLPFEEINKQIGKLRKYSFSTYVKANLQALQYDPKAYHRCIQNIIGWNLTSGGDTAIGGEADLDPQQIYEDPGGEVYYGKEAKARVQLEWEESYRSHNYDSSFKHRIDTDLVVKSITKTEIVEAINKTGKKGLAWDCIATWAIKLISKLTATELLKVAEEAEADLQDIDLS